MELLQAKQAADLHTAIFNQCVVADVLQTGMLDAHVEAILARYRTHRDAMAPALDQHMTGLATWTQPVGGMFFWLELAHGLDAMALPRPAWRACPARWCRTSRFFTDGSTAAAPIRRYVAVVSPDRRFPMRRPLSALLFTTALVLVAIPAAAQPLGTFSWQLQPYCNVITATVTQVGGTYRIEGTDSQCGATPASAIGMAFPNASGTVSFGITIVTGPAAAPVHVRATIDLASLSGPWTDSAGNNGTFAFNQNTGGAARPAPAVPALFGTTLVQPTDGVDRGLSARVNTDTGGTLGDSAAVFGQFGDASGWYSPGSAGVRGDSASQSGVVGTTASGEGVVGIASSGIGVYGYASAGGRGVYARTNDGGTALEINNGAIRVSGAVTPAFVHVTAAGNISYNTTRIDHPLTDGDPNAILIVTHDYGSGPYQTVPVGVWYDAGKWKIFNEDALVNMTAGRRFNVVVFKR